MARPLRPTRNSLETYFFEIDETPLLNAEQERELGRRIEDGDAEARDHLARANLRLVVSIARGYRSNGLAMEDMIEEGNLGLMRAVEGFDPSMNTRFSTYASYWIRQSIKRAVINGGKTIRLPAYTVDLLAKWRGAAAQLQEELGRVPTPEEVAGRLHLSARRLNIVKKALSVGAGLAQDDDERPLDAMLADDRREAPDAGITRSDELRQVLGLFDKLDSREAAVLRLRFGLDGQDGQDGQDAMTLRAIGERLSLTRERVRQIERDALTKLREGLEAA